MLYMQRSTQTQLKMKTQTASDGVGERPTVSFVAPRVSITVYEQKWRDGVPLPGQRLLPKYIVEITNKSHL